ncbi:MAG: molybdenum cofactor guanylyltransferase [Sphingobium sp.]
MKQPHIQSHAAPRQMLGAVLAGGQARRFGSDKAVAQLDGQSLMAHAINALAAQTHQVIVCGRAWPDGIAVPDRPHPDLGPLGGLNAALHFALAQGFDAVLTVGCDTPLLPPDLVQRLTTDTGPAVLDRMPIIGYWPASLAEELDAHLQTSSDRSIRKWARMTGARYVTLDIDIANINTPADLDALKASQCSERMGKP